ncbi:MAG: anhydro-N-acetylmuramic acid kinase, partial [Chitinophagaceae bacterium]
HQLNNLPYYSQPFPKSLANSFGTDEIYPLVQTASLSTADALRTYVEHIVQQITSSINDWQNRNNSDPRTANEKLLVTGGGAFNTFLTEQLSTALKPLSIEVVVPDPGLVQYKEALIMAFIGVLRWRQEYNVLSSVTGASRDSIGGAVWIGQEA